MFEVKANLHKYISRIILFIKTAVSINSSLDPGPQPLAGLHHGVPVEGPHAATPSSSGSDPWFVAKLFNELQIRPTQNSEKSYN